MIILPMRYRSYLVAFGLLCVSVVASGCFHQQVVTGKDPSSTVIENKWATSLVYGLVPPPVVETAQECQNGVASVETKISFLNGLVGGLTLNIYTPMTVRVTCASGAMSTHAGDNEVAVPDSATDDEVSAVMLKAVNTSLATGQPVAIHFE